ncbi:DUF6463 family protein [Knoellia subterranea]|uniref:Uncharacterized protein n=1 Tax=Knoellia subterranea KCTC 19937 TaxID=1385521 RepID=A0A0A0JGH5_9MICO|nr:DUF6463 family protein [Knoellia subterranea]KGN36243.1 hypothetical protein N803_05105 [Knoellia subterranea KCTC 19937]
MKVWQSSGAWTTALAVVHVAATTLFYGDSVRSIVDSGILFAVDADPALTTVRGAAFWYVTAGLLLGLVGLMVLAEERRTGRPPAGFAALMAVTGVWGILMTPLSGFWLFLPIAALARWNRSRSTQDRP